ncbi:UDP-glucose/GDP-mannose dehydrogenase family protein [Candidatus Uhrbacteria bacterium]|nr:UDP-glucose/GDP-mannose dehydrogenase family protein [Candidatus Uhrbacteria bacterium]
MQRQKIAVIGYGYVGKAYVKMLEGHYDVVVYDPVYSQDHNYEGVHFVDSLQGFEDCALGVICVPTPQAPDGSCDTTYVRSTLETLNTPLIVIKSTVTPGTTDELRTKTGKRLIFSPEYVGESKYYNPFFSDNMKEVPFVIAGGNDKDCNDYFDLLIPILGPTKTYFKTTSLSAEVIKYMENTYFAIKLTFINEMYNICQALGADWYAVREGWLLDPRVERMHTAVFPSDRGFKGKCLPKDTQALVQAARNNGYEPRFLLEMIENNSNFIKMEKSDTHHDSHA